MEWPLRGTVEFFPDRRVIPERVAGEDAGRSSQYYLKLILNLKSEAIYKSEANAPLA
jgi:hypothetical protein